MHVTLRLPSLAGLLLVAATPFAAAETPLPDPVPPAVIGRPLDQIRPARPIRQKPPVAAKKRTSQVAISNKGVPRQPAAPAAIAPAPVQAAPVAQHGPKQALDDRADPQARIADNVGKGPLAGGRPAGPGIYLGSKDEALVRRFYAANPVSGTAATWKIGEPVPARAAVKGLPDHVRAALPQAPGHEYVQLDGDVVLVAVQSRMVVDGISRNPR